jgi:hypothetical protein
MSDPLLQGDDWKTIFDGKRMIYGGFKFRFCGFDTKIEPDLTRRWLRATSGAR